MKLDVGVLQVNTSDLESPIVRIERVLKIISSATNLDLIVLPEHWITGAFSKKYNPQEMCALYEKFLCDVKSIAYDNKTIIHSGSGLVNVARNKYSNCTHILYPYEQTPTKYLKIHPFFNEIPRIEPGKTAVKFTVKDIEISLAICYDLRFPELFRQPENFGAELFIVSACWPKQRIQFWKHLLISRAIENQAYVLGVNSVGFQDTQELGGNSTLINPNGEIECIMNDKEDFQIVRINSDQVKTHRIVNPYLVDASLRKRSTNVT